MMCTSCVEFGECGTYYWQVEYAERYNYFTTFAQRRLLVVSKSAATATHLALNVSGVVIGANPKIVDRDLTGSSAKSVAQE